MFLLNCRYTIGIPVKADVVWDTEHWLFVQLYKSKQHYPKKKNMCHSPLIKSVPSKNSASAKNKNKNFARSSQLSEEQEINLVWPKM